MGGYLILSIVMPNDFCNLGLTIGDWKAKLTAMISLTLEGKVRRIKAGKKAKLIFPNQYNLYYITISTKRVGDKFLRHLLRQCGNW